MICLNKLLHLHAFCIKWYGMWRLSFYVYVSMTKYLTEKEILRKIESECLYCQLVKTFATTIFKE